MKRCKSGKGKDAHSANELVLLMREAMLLCIITEHPNVVGVHFTLTNDDDSEFWVFEDLVPDFPEGAACTQELHS